MLLPRRLTVQGFRGFRDAVEFHFDRPATLLFGENRSGKSSTLNAIEWCLFGDDCLGKQTGIRERIGWVVANRHLPAPDVHVALELANNSGSFVVERRQHCTGKRSRTTELQLTLPDGECLTGEVARQRLTQLVGSEFRDFLTMVYQHQESIRAILTQEPRERNDAIDRLLGLSVYRNVQDALVKAKAADRQRSMRAQFEAFEQRVQTALTTRKHDLDELRQEAARGGVALHQHGDDRALTRAAAVKRSLEEFARDVGLELPVLHLPSAWTGLPIFDAAARKTVSWLRCEMPSVKEQQDLFHRQKGLLDLKAELENARAGRDAVGRDVRALDVQYSGQKALATQIEAVNRTLCQERDRLRLVNGKAALLAEAISYLEQAAAGQASDECPLCGQATPELLAGLRRHWQESTQAQVALIQTRIQELNHRAQALKTGADRYREHDEQLRRALQSILRCRKTIGDHLGKTLHDDDDPLPLLIGELDAIEQRGRKLQAAVETRHKRLEELEQELHKLRLIHGILHGEAKRSVLEEIQHLPAYTSLETIRDQVADFTTDLEAIQAAVAAVAHEEAGLKLHTAESTIDTYFRALTRHPAVKHIRLRLEQARGQRNSYEITDQDDRDLTPILSQGDLNALALAVFLGLAAASADSGGLGFVMLDDPSQSLGSQHKKQLVQVLQDVAGRKQVLLATMDGELRTLLAEHLGKAKTEYAFGPWAPETGPSVTPGRST